MSGMAKSSYMGIWVHHHDDYRVFHAVHDYSKVANGLDQSINWLELEREDF